jgi:predicted transcriptional regulator
LRQRRPTVAATPSERGSETFEPRAKLPSCYHATMPKNLTIRLDDELAADTAALARAEGVSLNETVKQALKEAVERRRSDPAFKARVRRIIDEDRELLERLAK